MHKEHTQTLGHYNLSFEDRDSDHIFRCKENIIVMSRSN